jgi:glycine/D-amino acid oxidase-like deaminating enzyme
LPSLPALRQRILQEYPDHVRYGIHVMASQNHLGEVLIGDSHEYDDAITPFDNSTIDDLILSYLERMLEIPAPAIQSRWHGIYAKHPSRPIVLAEPMPGRVVVAGIGGAGMTLSFGLAEAWWEAHLQGQSLDHLIGGSAA